MGSNRNAAHRGPGFLPWHRVFIRSFERVLQVLSGDLTLGIPYWNWTADQDLPGGPLSSPLWTDSYIGPSGDPTLNYAIPSGPFCSVSSATCNGNWPVLAQLNGPYLQRELCRQNCQLPTDLEISAMLNITSYDDPSRYDDLSNPALSFRNAMEGWVSTPTYGLLHNGVHVLIGGSMGLMSSPNDPAFFIHHANIDRLWYKWQTATNCWSSCYRPHLGDGSVTSSTPGALLISGQWRIPGHEWESRMFPWVLHPKDVADQTNSLHGYVYA